MLAGVSGDLLAGRFLDGLVEEAAVEDQRTATWVRSGARWWQACARRLGPAMPPRAVLDIGGRPLLEGLGLSLTGVEPAADTLSATVLRGDRRVATLTCTAWGRPISQVWRQAIRASLAADVPWALVFTGNALEILDATRPWARRSVHVDLDAACRDRRALTALWLLVRGDALDDRAAGALARLATRSEAEGLAVCHALGAGVLEALGALLEGLDAAAGRGSTSSASPRPDRRVFDQSLTIVYRLLFLFFAEARRLLPVWHEVYREGYSVEALVRRALDARRRPGTWATVQAMSRLAHAGCEADDLRVTAFNGRLFAPSRTPLGERGRVPDEAAARAVVSLGTRPTPGGRQRIAFDDLGVEQLGSVYEQVLDFEPVRQGGRLALRRTSTERKTTGSFYTPRAMTDFVVRRTLAPLVDGLSADGILDLRVLDPAMGSGAFLVAAGRFLTERAEAALVVDGTWTTGAVSRADRADLARRVAERCLYGIDRNPTAVQLARLSLWLATLAADRPLTFLDHHLTTGNSLVGARLHDLARPPSSRAAAVDADGQAALFDDEAMAALARVVVPERRWLADGPSASADDVRAKERCLERLARDPAGLARWAAGADLWCGLALGSQRISSGLYAEAQRRVTGATTALPAAVLDEIVATGQRLARAHGACHPELAFAEVFLDADGQRRPDAGFDAVLGNPPWEMVRADAGDDDARADGRRRGRELLRFVRGSGHYRLQGAGQVNQYQLFVERALDLLRPGGRLGLVLPGGLQVDAGSAHLRRRLLDGCALDTWVAFENRRAIFPIHRSMRFVIVTGTSGPATAEVVIRGGLTEAGDLARIPDRASAERPSGTVRVATSFLRQWDPEHLTIPAVRDPLDLAIACRALAQPPLGARHGWQVRFGRELNATDDRGRFVAWPPDRGAARERWLPVVDGRHLRPFGVALDGVRRAIRADDLLARLTGEVGPSRPRVAYRDVAGAANRLTLIAARLPAGVTATHTVFTARGAPGRADSWALVGLLNSLAANFLVRLQVSTHVTTALMARLPVPVPTPGDRRRLAVLARRLARASSIDEAPEAYACLNALAGRLYGLTDEEYAHVVGSFALLGEALARHCLTAWSREPVSGPASR